jgi:hypothetical protein
MAATPVKAGALARPSFGCKVTEPPVLDASLCGFIKVSNVILALFVTAQTSRKTPSCFEG